MNIEPFPLEKELRVEAIKRHLTELPRDELIEGLATAIDTLTRMTDQTKQLVAYIEIMEEKLGWVENNADSAGNSTN
jgi:hypothetical protein